MKQTLFNQGWLTWQETDAFSMVWNIPAGAKPVTLPHDAMLQHPAHAESPNGGNTGYRDGGVYVYCKRFHVPVEWREKTILLRFEGSYCNTFIYLNGQLAADHPNGYTGFTVSLNGFLQYGHENELRVQDLTWQKRLQVVVLILLIVVILAIGAFILYYRKERGYRQILKLRQEAAEKEKWYRTQLQKYSREPEQGIVYHTETEQDDKLYELFTRLQTLMSEQKIYMRPDLSRDAVAKLLSTNRTYLSEAISRYTGLSFVYYVNSFRIDAAVRILSDPNDETPIKALVHELGFHSMSTFYRLFQAAKGVPPSQFREQRKRHA